MNGNNEICWIGWIARTRLQAAIMNFLGFVALKPFGDQICGSVRIAEGENYPIWDNPLALLSDKEVVEYGVRIASIKLQHLHPDV